MEQEQTKTASKKSITKRVKPAVGWVVFSLAVAAALAMVITMCVIALR